MPPATAARAGRIRPPAARFRRIRRRKGAGLHRRRSPPRSPKCSLLCPRKSANQKNRGVLANGAMRDGPRTIPDPEPRQNPFVRGSSKSISRGTTLIALPRRLESGWAKQPQPVQSEVAAQEMSHEAPRGTSEDPRTQEVMGSEELDGHRRLTQSAEPSKNPARFKVFHSSLWLYDGQTAPKYQN